MPRYIDITIAQRGDGDWVFRWLPWDIESIDLKEDLVLTWHCFIEYRVISVLYLHLLASTLGPCFPPNITRFKIGFSILVFIYLKISNCL
jgi:hypothetical protein